MKKPVLRKFEREDIEAIYLSNQNMKGNTENRICGGKR